MSCFEAESAFRQCLPPILDPPALPCRYEAGWGKRLSYVIAVGWNGTADVTRRYTQQYEEVQKK